MDFRGKVINLNAQIVVVSFNLFDFFVDGAAEAVELLVKVQNAVSKQVDKIRRQTSCMCFTYLAGLNGSF